LNPTICENRASVEVGSGLSLTKLVLHKTCGATARGRPFDLVVNNCQRFCSHILQGLLDNGTITQDQFDALAAKGFEPLV
jgi:hypothetical protein